MELALRPPSIRTVGRLFGVLGVLATVVALTTVLFPDPLADAFFAGIVLLGVVFAIVGGIGAWTNRTAIAWAGALLVTGLATAGMWSIGRHLAPAALLLLGAAVLTQLAAPRRPVPEERIADPPERREVLLGSLVGAGSVVLGSGLVYTGAFVRGLFGACADETVTCALEATRWDAVAMTVVGMVAIGFGGWLLRQQVASARVLAVVDAE